MSRNDSHVHHEAHHDARGAAYVASHSTASDSEFELRRAAALHKHFGTDRSTPSTTFTRLDAVDEVAIDVAQSNALTDDERQKRDLAAKQEVSHNILMGGHLALVKLLKENMTNEFVLWRSVRALRDLAHQDEQVRDDCVSSRADEIMLQIMDAYPQSAIVQAQCIRLLGSLSYGNDLVRRRCAYVYTSTYRFLFLIHFLTEYSVGLVKSKAFNG